MACPPPQLAPPPTPAGGQAPGCLGAGVDRPAGRSHLRGSRMQASKKLKLRLLRSSSHKLLDHGRRADSGKSTVRAERSKGSEN
eukprot:5636666-Pyramimonas_sp.AAC.1